MPYTVGGSSGKGGGITTAISGAGIRATNPVFEKTKSIAYGTSDQIYSASATASSTAPSGAIPQSLELTNNGGVPLNILVGYETYSNETTASSATRYLHIMLMPGEIYYPSIRAVISTEAASTQFDGTALSNQVPNSNMYADISTVSSGFDNTTDPVTIASADGDFWRVGDMIRSNAEVVEVTAISAANLTVKRAMLGTSAASHSDSETLRLQFSNDYHDIDKYSVCQTDFNGKFKCSNFFGIGRTASGKQGIVPGSVAIKFYQSGYQNLGLSGISSSTNSGLTASTAYKIDITVDGGTMYQDLTFTTDTSNLNFGGTNGIINKIQSALDTQFYTAGNLFEKKVNVGIVNGDIRFTSGSHLSTSAISLTDTGDGLSFIEAAAQTAGRIPAVSTVAGGIRSAVPARLPDDVVYDRITYEQSPNTGVFGYDDGFGNLSGMCNGIVNYETGAIDMRGCPANAEFVYTVAHSSGFSGKLDTGANAIVDILANTPSQKWAGSVTVKVF